MEVRFGIESMHGDNRDYGIERYWKYARKGRIGSRINTDGFPKRGLKILGGVRGHVPPGKFFRFWLPEVLFPGFLSHSDRILASSIPLRWSLVNWRIIWPFPRILGHRWRKTKEQKPWNINWADFSLNRKQRSISFFVICVQNKVLTDYFISQFQLMESFFN